MLGNSKRLERKLTQQGGKQAWATVLESKKLYASSLGGKVQQKLRLRVEPQGEPTFEATVHQEFNNQRGWHIPQEGYSVTVIYDPSDHSKLLIDIDKMPVAPGIDRDEAVARHEKVMARVKDPAARRQQIEEMKGQAAAGAPGAAAIQEMIAKATAGALAAASKSDVASELTKLADLRGRGVLSDAEFEAQKAKILATS